MILHGIKKVIEEIGPSAIAVSGGIDSLTLATVAYHQYADSEVFHAISAAVPPDATLRVREFAQIYKWRLHEIDTQDLSDPNYRQNPVNRCFYCKRNLYRKIRSLTRLQILSGTNLDDLDDFRPGLTAAKTYRVRHPFVEAGINKEGIRAIARELGLVNISDLPAAPCLSSRINTGLEIAADDLRTIDRVERSLKQHLGEITLRCRLTENGIVLEVAESVLSQMQKADAEDLLRIAREEIDTKTNLLGVVPYVRGSAFIQ